MKLIHEMHRFIFSFGRLVDKEITERLGITFPQFVALLVINEHKGCQQKDIVDFRKLTKAAISKQMGVLKKGGLVKITINPENKREDVVVLTDWGKDIFKKAQKIFNRENDRIFNNLTKEERNNLEAILLKITNYVKTDN